MAATSVPSSRTAFPMAFLTALRTAFQRILAFLGLATPSREPYFPAVVPSCASPVRLPAQRSGSRSLPPTIKQRIRAEAHGSSPSVRRAARTGPDGERRAPEEGRAVLG